MESLFTRCKNRFNGNGKQKTAAQVGTENARLAGRNYPFAAWMPFHKSNTSINMRQKSRLALRVSLLLWLFVSIAFSITIVAPLIVRQDQKELESLYAQTLKDHQNNRAVTDAQLSKAEDQGRITLARKYFAANTKIAKTARSAPINARAVAGISQRYALMGILMGDKPQAILKEVLTDNSIFITTEQMLDKYRVAQIERDRIILEYKGERIELTI